MSFIETNSLAAIDPNATLGAGTTVGPFAVIGPNVAIGHNVKIHSHAVILGQTEIGDGCEIYPFAVVGAPPQDKKYAGEESRLTVGASTIIREHVTMNGGTAGGGNVTRVGSHCLFLTGSHVAHDCQIGDHVTVVNGTGVAGHVAIGDHAIVGGYSAIHQWVRIGAHAFVGGMSAIETDVIPFGMALGNRAYLGGLNIVGMKRHGFEREQIHALRRAYRLLFSQDGTLQERLDDVDKMFPADSLVQRVVGFMRAGTDRSYCTPRNQP